MVNIDDVTHALRHSREAAVNIAEGAKQAQILASEAERKEQVNQALGEAEAIEAKAIATATAIEAVAKAMQTPGGNDVVKLQVATEYVQAFGNIAKEGNTMLIPANAGEPAAMVAQAMSIYDTVRKA